MSSATSLGWAGPDRDTSKRVHQSLASPIIVRAAIRRQFVNQSYCGFRLNPAGRDANDPNSFRAYLL